LQRGLNLKKSVIIGTVPVELSRPSASTPTHESTIVMSPSSSVPEAHHAKVDTLELHARNRQSTAHRLPPELLVEIFHVARDSAGEGERGRTVWRISQVSHYWRAVALFEHNLWDFIDFSNRGWVKEFIQRALPSRPSASLCDMSIEVFRPVVEQLPYLESVSIFRGDGLVYPEAYEHQDPWAQAAPYLRELSLKGVDICDNFLAKDAPLLQQLTLTRCGLLVGHSLLFTFPNLVSLVIDDPSDLGGLDPLIDVIQLMPLLEELKLVSVLQDYPGAAPKHHHTPFPRIRFLHLSSTNLPGALLFLKAVALSPSVEVEIDVEECWLPLTRLTTALRTCQGGAPWILESLHISTTKDSASLRSIKYVSEDVITSTNIKFKPLCGDELNLSEMDEIVSSYDLSRLTCLDLWSSGTVIPQGIWTTQFNSLPHLQSLAVRGSYSKSFLKYFAQPIDQVSELLDSHKLRDREEFLPFICFPTLLHLTLQRLKRQGKDHAQAARWPILFSVFSFMLGLRQFARRRLAELTIIGYELGDEEMERLEASVEYVECFLSKRGLEAEVAEYEGE
ncbi:hypothetical protein BDN72DRAFT_831811, partial [Pluteus cervinus]